jgi:tetratricopeptide (TPR) repeat protein
MLVSGCNRSPRQRAARFIEAGKRQLAQRHYDRAVLEFKNAAQALPQDAEPYYQLGLAYLAVGDAGAAVLNLSWACDRNPKHSGAQLKLAELLAGTADPRLWADAEQRAALATAQQPGNADALQILALAEYRQGKTDDAVQHLTEALSHSEGRHYKASMMLAAIKLDAKDLTAVNQILRETADRATGIAEVQVAVGQFYFMLAKLPEAEARFRRALAIDPRNGPAMFELARLQASSGRQDAAEGTLRSLATLPDESYRTIHARFLFDAGNREGAIAELEALSRKDPKNRDVRSRLVEAYLATDRLRQAEQILDAALRVNAGDVDALLQRGQTYIIRSTPERAEGDLQQVLRSLPRSAQAHYLLAQVYRANGNASRARSELGDALQYDPTLLSARLQLSENLRAARDVENALQVLDKMPEEQKSQLPAISERNWVLLALGEYDEAERGIQKGLKVAVTAPLLFQDALVKQQRRQFSSGRHALEQALQLAPDDMQILDALATNLTLDNQPDAAVERIRRHAVEHNAAPVHHLLGLCLEKTGNPKEARRAYAAAMAADAAYAPPYVAAARLDLLDQRWDSARQMLAHVTGAKPPNLDAMLAQGMLEEATGHYDAAIREYRAILEISPHQVVAMNNLAVRLSENPGTADEALNMAQRVKELAPENQPVDDTIGWAYYKKGIYRTAISYLVKAAASNQTAQVQYHLAMAYFKAGEAKLGRAALGTGEKLDPTIPEARMAQQIAASAE